MGIGALVLAFFKGNWLKLLKYGVIIIAVAGVTYKAYDWCFQRGVTKQAAIDKVIIDRLNGKVTKANTERDAAVTEKDRYVSEYNTFVQATKDSRKLADQQSAAALAEIQGKLHKTQTTITNLKGQLHDALNSYIPPDVDATYSLPMGFVSLYNHAVQGTPGSGAFLALPGSTGFMANAPSGVTYSTFAGIVIDNTSECLARGALIDSWQTWYHHNKAIFDKLLTTEDNRPPVK